MLDILLGVALIATPVHAQIAPEVPLIALIERAALKHGVPTTTLYNLAYSESRLDPLADNGHDRGIVQINRTYHPEIPDSCAFDPACALDWAADRIKAGYIHEWTSANCWSYIKVLLAKEGRTIARMKDIWPNTPLATGTVAVMYSNGLKHIAYVSKIESEGYWVKEANWQPALIAPRFVSFSDKRVIGFWRPSD